MLLMFMYPLLSSLHQQGCRQHAGRQLCENSVHGNEICCDLLVEWLDNMPQGGNKDGDGGDNPCETAIIIHSH